MSHSLQHEAKPSHSELSTSLAHLSSMLTVDIYPWKPKAFLQACPQAFHPPPATLLKKVSCCQSDGHSHNKLLCFAELHKSQVEGKVYRPGPMSNQVESIIRVQLPDQRDTLVFQGEEGDLSVPPDQDSQGLQELGQINPDDLKCKRKATGELFKLGSGESQSPVIRHAMSGWVSVLCAELAKHF